MKRLICMILCLCLVFPLLACEPQYDDNSRIFYYRRSTTAFSGTNGVLAPERRDLRQITGDLGAILDLYCQGPYSEGLENPLPPGTQVKTYSLKDGQLSLHFNDKLMGLSGIDLTLAAGCVARTFLEITGAEVLIITADGTLLNGQTSMRLTLQDLALMDGSTERLHRELTVYYTDQNRRYLIGQEVSLTPVTPEELPMQLLSLLQTAPSGLNSALPVDIKFRSVTITDGLCVVDMSPEFESRRFFSHAGQLLSLMAIVNTLTGLSEVERVEFTIDGQLLIRYGPLSIPEPMVFDDRCIGPVRTGLGERDMTLYLSHGEEGRLLTVPVRLTKSSTYSDAEQILRYLLDDPGTNGIETHIPKDTALISVSVTDGICFVDLSREYMSNPSDLLLSNRVIAASLCTLDAINQVQIMVEGSIPTGFDPKIFGLLRPTSDWYL